MYAILLNGELDRYPLSLAQVRRAFPNVSFAVAPTEADLARYGVVKLLPSEPPEYDPRTHAAVPDTPRPIAGQWVTQWQVQPREIAELLAQRNSMVCTPRQARLALQQAGLLPAVTAWIAQADASIQIEWEFASEIRRDWPPIAACVTALGLTDLQLDDLFTLAVTL